MQQTRGYQRMSCSSCTIYEDEWFLSALSQSQEHPVLDQKPTIIMITNSYITVNLIKSVVE